MGVVDAVGFLPDRGPCQLECHRRVVEVRSLAVHVNTTLQAQAMLPCIACNMSLTLKWLLPQTVGLLFVGSYERPFAQMKVSDNQ
ncbi:unnamed protein product [Boreogadus saida]